VEWCHGEADLATRCAVELDAVSGRHCLALATRRVPVTAARAADLAALAASVAQRPETPKARVYLTAEVLHTTWLGLVLPEFAATAREAVLSAVGDVSRSWGGAWPMALAEISARAVWMEASQDRSDAQHWITSRSLCGITCSEASPADAGSTARLWCLCWLVAYGIELGLSRFHVACDQGGLRLALRDGDTPRRHAPSTGAALVRQCASMLLALAHDAPAHVVAFAACRLVVTSGAPHVDFALPPTHAELNCEATTTEALHAILTALVSVALDTDKADPVAAMALDTFRTGPPPSSLHDALAQIVAALEKLREPERGGVTLALRDVQEEAVVASRGTDVPQPAENGSASAATPGPRTKVWRRGSAATPPPMSSPAFEATESQALTPLPRNAVHGTPSKNTPRQQHNGSSDVIALQALDLATLQQLRIVLTATNHCAEGELEVVGAWRIRNELVAHTYAARQEAMVLTADAFGCPHTPLPDTIRHPQEQPLADDSPADSPLFLSGTLRDIVPTSAAANEVVLLHGTSLRAAAEIVAGGFDERVAKESGNLFGCGTYATNTMCKAHKYATPYSEKDADAARRLSQLAKTDLLKSILQRAPTARPLFVVRALLGETLVTTQALRGLRRPPEIPRQPGSNNFTTMARRYDSVIGNGKQHKEFVLYDRGQILAELLVLYTLRASPTH
jgi:hypothetical protein